MQWPIQRTGLSLAVPRTAIASDLEHTFVIRVRDNKTEWVRVQAGRTKDDLSEVLGDLEPGDLIVVRATDELRPETAITAVRDDNK